MAYTFVYLGCSNDYDLITYRETNKNISNVLYYPDPYHSLSGIMKYIYEIHNSRRINSVFRLPFKKIWAKTFLPKSISNKLNNSDDICFIFNEFIFGFLQNGVIDYIKKRYINAKLVCLFDDKVDKIKSLYDQDIIIKGRDIFDFILSYNMKDVRDYDLIYSPPSLIDYSFVKENEDIPFIDVFYIGRAKDRLTQLINIYDLCSSVGYKCLFYIVDVPEQSIVNRGGIIYNTHMSYDKLLEYCKRSRCILNYTQDGAEGITLRDYEAISMNKFLITNNPIIKQTPFYTSEKVIMVNNLKQELSKISDKNQTIEWNGKNECSIYNYYIWLEGLLNGKGDIDEKNRH